MNKIQLKKTLQFAINRKWITTLFLLLGILLFVLELTVFHLNDLPGFSLTVVAVWMIMGAGFNLFRLNKGQTRKIEESLNALELLWLTIDQIFFN